MDKEVQHLTEILEATKQALKEQDSIRLKELSNQTIHSASVEQHTDSITIAVLVYALSKLLERRDTMKIKNWGKITKKINSFFSLAITALKQGNRDKYLSYLEMSRKTLNSISINLKPYVQDVLRKAEINKASRIYEHGISLGQTAKLLGLSQWELSEYTGQMKSADIEYNRTLDVKKRAEMALEFFG